MRFARDPSRAPFPGRLSYVAAERGFLFQAEPVALGSALGEEGEASLCLDTLQLVASRDSGRVLFPCGYCPHTSWKAALVEPPPSAPGTLVLVEPTPGELLRGAGHDLDDRTWEIMVDRRSGWLRLAPPGADPTPGAALEFAPGCLASLDEQGRLVALHLHPAEGLTSA